MWVTPFEYAHHSFGAKPGYATTLLFHSSFEADVKAVQGIGMIGTGLGSPRNRGPWRTAEKVLPAPHFECTIIYDFLMSERSRPTSKKDHHRFRCLKEKRPCA